MTTITDKELALLFPEKTVEIAGVNFEIRPFSFSETRTVFRLLKDVLHVFTREGDLTPDDLAIIFDKAYDGIAEVLSMVYGLDRKAVDKLDNASAIKMIVEVVMINKGFFSDEIMPVLAPLMETMTEQQ